MSSRLIPMLLAAGLLSLASPSARADVILNFTQVGPTMQTPYGGGPPFPNAILGDISMVFTDAAFAGGVQIEQRNGDGVPRAQLDGLKALHVDLQNLFEAISVSLPDFTDEIPIVSTERSAITLTSGAGQIPVGSVFYSSPMDLSVRFTFDGTDQVSGYVIGDGTCNAGCRFAGVLTVTVPEPASVLTFGLGLLALGLTARRRRVASAEAA